MGGKADVPGIDALPHEALREALRLLGHREPPGQRVAALAALREHLTTPGSVRSVLDQAPDGAREAFATLSGDGAASVEQLLGRGWWGRGTLPPPLDWLQRRALVVVGDDGLVYPSEQALGGFLDRPRPQGDPAPAGGTQMRVLPAGAVVVAGDAAALDRAVAVEGAALRAIAPTVAVSERSATAVQAVLRAAGLALTDDLSVMAQDSEPALPFGVEDAVGPRSVRALLQRAVADQRQVQLEYFASSRGGSPSDRTVCPWRFADDLLVGYCHLRDGERTFAVDRVGRARLLPDRVEHPAP